MLKTGLVLLASILASNYAIAETTVEKHLKCINFLQGKDIGVDSGNYKFFMNQKVNGEDGFYMLTKDSVYFIPTFRNSPYHMFYADNAHHNFGQDCRIKNYPLKFETPDSKNKKYVMVLTGENCEKQKFNSRIYINDDGIDKVPTYPDQETAIDAKFYREVVSLPINSQSLKVVETDIIQTIQGKRPEEFLTSGPGSYIDRVGNTRSLKDEVKVCQGLSKEIDQALEKRFPSPPPKPIEIKQNPVSDEKIIE